MRLLNSGRKRTNFRARSCLISYIQAVRNYLLALIDRTSNACWIALLCLLVPGWLVAQSSKTDSLKQLIQEAEEDTNKVKLLLELTKHYEATSIENAVDAGFKGINLAMKLKNKRLATEGFRIIGDACTFQGDFEAALNYYRKGLESANDYGDSITIATHRYNVGVAHYYLGNHEEALKYQLDAIGIFDKYNQQKAKASAVNCIGNIYYSQGNYEKAKEYYVEAVSIRETIGDTKHVVVGLNNLGLVTMQQKEYEESISYHTKALKLYTESNDEKGIGTSLSNIGLVHQELKNYDKALEYYERSLEIRERINDHFGVGISLFNMGQVFLMQQKYDKAIDYMNRSLRIAREIGDREGVKYAYEFLALTYSKMKDYEQAYDYYQRFTLVKDSMINEASNKQMAELETRYKTKEREREIELLNKDKALRTAKMEKDGITKWSLGIFLVLIAVFAVFVINRLRASQKQGKLIAQQKLEVEEKNKEVLDSINYARRLQDAILPPTNTFHSKFQDSFILYKPKDIVAGDFYWMAETESEVLFAVADCTGHGVPGAMVSVVCSNALNESFKELNSTDPGAILTRTRDLLVKRFESSEHEISDGMDIALCTLNKQQKTLKFAGANNSLYYIGTDGLQEVKADKQPIGQHVTTNAFTTKEIALEDEMRIYLFTDGYPDQFGGESGKKFKYTPFKELISSVAMHPFEDQQKTLDDTFEKWRRDHEQIDDVCVVGVRV